MSEREREGGESEREREGGGRDACLFCFFCVGIL